MTATIIDGKGIAADLRGRVADAVHRLVRDRGITPGLAVVLVGNNPASESYVGSKMKTTAGSGMRSFDHRRDIEAAEIGHQSADRSQRRLGDAVKEIADHADRRIADVDHAECDQPGEYRRSDQDPDVELQGEIDDEEERVHDPIR